MGTLHVSAIAKVNFYSGQVGAHVFGWPFIWRTTDLLPTVNALVGYGKPVDHSRRLKRQLKFKKKRILKELKMQRSFKKLRNIVSFKPVIFRVFFSMVYR